MIFTKKVKHAGVFLMVFFFSFSWACRPTTPSRKIRGLVPDEVTATKIAEAILVAKYGQGIYEDEPFVAGLQDSIWRVEGTVHATHGGSFIVFILARDGRVLGVSHDK